MRRSTKTLLVIALLLLFLDAGAVAFLRFYWDIDVFDRSGWKEKDGVTYYLDYYGDPLTDWQEIGGSWYYLDPLTDGGRASGWVDDDGSRYYLASDGVLQLGWLELPEGRYYLAPPTGSMTVGWFQDGEHYYHCSQTGLVETGWINTPEGRYYMGTDGAMATGWQEVDGQRFHLDSNGQVTTGWVADGDQKCYFDDSGILAVGWQEIDGQRFYFDGEGHLATGWVSTGDGVYFLDETGKGVSGWAENNGRRYYLDETGKASTGWMELDGKKYYFLEDGAAAIGQVDIDGVPHFFSSQGENFLLVNKWNKIPETYQPDLKPLQGSWKMDASCVDMAKQMLKDCSAAGNYYEITSAYRSPTFQKNIFEKRVSNLKSTGLSEEAARAKVAETVAIPGYSEHQLGLALDISGPGAQRWLTEHCTEYGFVIRYPEDKKDLTGIAYERWHFRYVGVEMAKELTELNMCLEEYVAMLTKQAAS